ncbi:MAG: glycerophosphoryl diester phosphodiesterase membrane domain-containing protein [Methanosarcinaceae archaeon]|nr:glycerophosphoryl diester phosphodiesterase membrane domain-containing protein [Methanosarcinaceae archaeon]
MDIEVLLKDSWNIFKDNIIAYIIGTLIVILGSIIIVTIAPLLYGLAYMAVKGVKGEKVEINDVFEGFNHFVKSWIFLIVAGVLLFISYMLLVIPGIILSILLIYALPLLVIRDYSAIDAIKESINLAKANFKENIILFLIAMVLTAIGGWIRIGSVLTTPFVMILYTLGAHELIGESSKRTEIEGELE